MGQAEWKQGLVRQTLVEHLRHVVTASCGSHHLDTGSDWPQPGWQNAERWIFRLPRVDLHHGACAREELRHTD